MKRNLSGKLILLSYWIKNNKENIYKHKISQKYHIKGIKYEITHIHHQQNLHKKILKR